MWFSDVTRSAQSQSARGSAVVASPTSDAATETATLLEEFAEVIAHEMRTPLAIVLGAVDTVLTHHTEGTSEKLHELLQMIRRNAELATLLLGRLGLARDIEAGTVALSKGPVDIGSLVEESVSDLRSVILGSHPVEVHVSEVPLVSADPTAAREIVFNLLSNAAKYSDAAAPIAVRVSAVDGFVEVVVQNHGSGVTPGDTNAIFEKYWQQDAGSAGAGLGLYISRGLARAHGGDITVQPASDRGSEFRLSLPIPA